MSLSQTQIIQSLADALAWFEKELGWGVPPGELNHLTGRIGELYAAVVTRGQMALETNQRGYDVISADNERISVKTITSTKHVKFNPNTFDQVDRVMILRVNIDDDNEISVETLLDLSASDFLKNNSQGSIVFNVPSESKPKQPVEELKLLAEATWHNYVVRKFENGTIQVLVSNEIQPAAKPHLRDIAADIGVDLLNGNSASKNTRQLGADIIKVLQLKAS